MQFKWIKESVDEAGQVLLLLSKIQGHKEILANVYAPKIDDPTFFGDLKSKLHDIEDYPILVFG